ncbi:MAG: hypothetical protein C0402_06300 [Thermodesulfovibrio sp.]|nr:hypothetical protein [Thermodesulfovibrio sp.]
MNIRADKRILLLAGTVAVICLCLVMAGVVRSLKTENSMLKAKKKELALLKDETLSLKGKVDASEARKSLAKVEGVVQAIDEIVKSLGVAQKVKSVKSLGVRDRQYAVEEEAEVQFEKLSMNEMVNIFFRIENAPMVLAIKKTTLKTSFDSPSLLNISCIISLVKSKAESQYKAQVIPQAAPQVGAQTVPQAAPKAEAQVEVQVGLGARSRSGSRTAPKQSGSGNRRSAKSIED